MYLRNKKEIEIQDTEKAFHRRMRRGRKGFPEIVIVGILENAGNLD